MCRRGYAKRKARPLFLGSLVGAGLKFDGHFGRSVIERMTHLSRGVNSSSGG
jgi:hypothetical protein